MEREERPRILIITGLSGGGKTQAANCLEDLGYFCVDNLPPALIPKFTELIQQSRGAIQRVAFVIDVRGGEFFGDLFNALDELKSQGVSVEILFLEARDDVLVRRFKESRRKHPLDRDGDLPEAIRREQHMLQELRGQAHTVIDTSDINVHQLKEQLVRLYGQASEGPITVTVLSFGYKFGLPMDSDMVIDVRFLPNPNYVENLHSLTGRDAEVTGYVLAFDVTRDFLEKFMELLEFLLPHYVKEGKTHLVVAIGCTGGQHRSVVIADYIGQYLQEKGYHTIIKHRDLPKYRGNGW